MEGGALGERVGRRGMKKSKKDEIGLKDCLHSALILPKVSQIFGGEVFNLRQDVGNLFNLE